MAREIRAVSSTGTLYARIMNSAGLWWNGSTFEVYTALNYATYAISLTEQGNSNVYVADFPSAITTSGTYEYFAYRQLGGSPAEGDTVIGTGKIDWTGTLSVTATTGAMTGSDFYDYILRKGFKRTDKATEVYEAITDSIQELRRRFMFDEAEQDKTTTDTISVLGDFRLDLESDFGLLLSIKLQDGVNGTTLTKMSKTDFDAIYPDQFVTVSRGYPSRYCVYGGKIYIGPIPDKTTYTYRLNYSAKAGTVISSTSGVPFTDIYRDILCALVLSILYEGLEEYDKANYHRQKFETGFLTAKRRENQNTGNSSFNMAALDV